MQLFSVGPIEDGTSAFGQAFRSALKQSDEPVGAVLLYLPHGVDYESFLREVQLATNALTVGVTTGCSAFTERGSTERGVVAGILRGPEKIVSELAYGLSNDLQGAVRDAMERLKRRWERECPSQKLALLAFADAYACDGEQLAQALQANTSVHTRLFGGTAGDNFSFTQTFVIYKGELRTDAAVLVGLPAPPSLTVRANHGFSPVPDAREFIITRADGNVVYELDRMPARLAYERELRRLGLLKPGDDLLTTMGIYELGTKTVLGPEAWKIRTALRIDGDAVVLASSLPQDSVVRVVAAGPDRLIEAAAALARDSQGDLRGRPCQGALVFDCAARRKLLGERFDEEVKALCAGARHPMVGFASYGEIARSGGSLEGFHNTTAVMACW